MMMQVDPTKKTYLQSKAISKLIQSLQLWNQFSFRQFQQLWLCLSSYSEQVLTIHNLPSQQQQQNTNKNMQQQQKTTSTTTINNPNIIINLISILSSKKTYNLHKLILTQNNIICIQKIHRLQCPNIKHIDLSENTISCIASFSKINYPQLDTLIIQNNQYIENQSLCMSKISVDNKRLYVEIKDGMNIKWVAKLSVDNLQEIWFMGQSFKNGQVRAVIRRKYKGMHMPLLRIYDDF